MRMSLAMPRENRISYPGWRALLAATVGLAFSPGPLIFGSLGLFAPSLHATFGWGRGGIMLALTFFNVAGVLASPSTGRALDRWGTRNVLLPQLFALLLGFVLLTTSVNSLPMFYIVAFLWGLATVGTQSISYAKVITGWFSHFRGLAIGIAAAGLGLGYIVVPLVASALLHHYAWRGAWLALAAIAVGTSLLLNALFNHPNPAATGARASASSGLTAAEARRTAIFWRMAVAIFLGATALTGVVPHLALLATDRGFATGQAAMLAATYGISTVIGRILVGALADRFPVARVGAACLALSVVGFALAAALGGTAGLGLLMLIALTIGFGFGAESDVIALFIAHYFGQRSFGAIYGDLLSAFLIGASAGPALFGFGRDYAGGYAMPMAVAAVVVMLSCLLLATMPLRPLPGADRQDDAT